MKRKTDAYSAAKMRTESKLAAEPRRRVVAKCRRAAAKWAQSFEGISIQTAAFRPLISGDFPHRNVDCLCIQTRMKDLFVGGELTVWDA